MSYQSPLNIVKGLTADENIEINDANLIRLRKKLLAELKPLRKDGQAIEGMFVCVLVLVQHADDPLPQIFQGIWKGEVLEAARGENGFGYDPLFWLPELGLSSAEMSKEEKNKISHRGQAMQLFKASLEQ
jgi:XTP/dITP diphosphohydrolase